MLHIKNIHLKNYRNYTELPITFPTAGALFFGSNGSGKTNILEAIYMLCTGKSHRGALKSEMIHFGSDTTSIEGSFLSPGDNPVQQKRKISFDYHNNTIMQVNDRKIGMLSDWFGPHAIVSFATSDIQLVYGAPDLRRRFIDIFISHIDKEYLIALIQYKKNLVLRNKLLKISTDDLLFNIYEEKMAESGSIIAEKRRIMIEELGGFCRSIYREISGSDGNFLLTYEPSFINDYSSENSWKNVFYRMLSERRKLDRESGFTQFGPHRDDIEFLIDNKEAKTFSSQGQCRSLVLSLKIGSMLCLEKHLDDNVIVLFDDAVSELDADRAARTYTFIENRGQLFIASPNNNVPGNSNLTHFHVAAGAVTAV
jgi:DNA replication and repair protein RecF